VSRPGVGPWLEVMPCGPGFAGYCSDHGRLPCIWTDQWLAGMDLLGHRAHHHASKGAARAAGS
jgi:hypothetical protein